VSFRESRASCATPENDESFSSRKFRKSNSSKSSRGVSSNGGSSSSSIMRLSIDLTKESAQSCYVEGFPEWFRG
jgi:hypothetical protein